MPGPGPQFPAQGIPQVPGFPTSPVGVPGRQVPPSRAGYQDPLGTENRVGWQQTAVPLAFFSLLVPVTGVVARCNWRTPIFDFRRDLLLQQSGDPAYAQMIPRGSVYGIGATLFLQIHGVDALRAANVQVDFSIVEYAHPYNPELAAVRTVTQLQDVTSDVYDGGSDCLLTLTPPDGPVRYWGVALQCDQLTGNLGAMDGLLTLESALY